MDREKFCKMLSIARERSGKTIPQISYGIQMLAPSIYRLEKGTHNSRMDGILSYLEFIGYHIQLTKHNNTVNIVDCQDVVKWCKKLRGNTSRSAFAKKVGMNRSYPRVIESQQSVLSIDWVLKFAEVFGYSVALVNNC